MIVFPSRKNYVTMENGIVTKKFKNIALMEREKENLIVLSEKQIAVPQILGSSGEELYLKNIEGHTYCELSNELTSEQIISLLNWLDDFHNLTGFSRGDVNLKNFIYNDMSKSCFSVDFEDKFENLNATNDLGRILAFISTYDPIFSKRKVTSCRFLIEILRRNGVDLECVCNEFFVELSHMERRRNVEFDSFCVEKFWRAITK